MPNKTIDTLILVGNGFDMWQGVSTSYTDFEKYYIEHLSAILKHLHIKPWTIEDEDGTKRIVSDVEMLYGDPFDPYYLDSDFWNSFENSLSLIDDQRVNLYFGKEDLKRILLLADNSRRILQEAFSGWIGSKTIEAKDSGYIFPDNCFIVNFNYTDTVRKRFGVPEDNDYHIHGEAHDKESIIVGHSNHPEYPFGQLKKMGGRFEGLFYIEKALYESDKHVDDNYQDMAMNLAMEGANLKGIKNVYILGHSFGEADYGYFRHLAYAMNDIDEDPFEGIANWCLKYLSECDETDAVALNLDYALHHRERLGKEADIQELPDLDTLKKIDQVMESSAESFYYRLSHDQQSCLEKAAVRARFLMEQGARNAQYEFDFLDMMSEMADDFPKITKQDRKKFEKQLQKVGWKDCQDVIKDVLKDRKNGCLGSSKSGAKHTPTWHISYYSDDDKARIQDVMHRIHYDNYKLYPDIDECIKDFKK